MARRGKHTPGQRTVMLARFSALGDIALTIPALYEACRHNPGVRFVMVTRRHPATMFIGAPSNLTVEGLDLDEWKGIGGMRRLTATLRRRYSPDVFIDLHDVLRTRLMRFFCRLHGMKVSVIDKGRREKRALTRSGRKELVQLPGTTRRYADAMRRGGIRMPEPLSFRSIFAGETPHTPFLPATAPKREGERWYAVAPFARHAGKIYPPELMRRVVTELAAPPGAKVFVFGFGAGESALIEEWRAGRDNIVNMASLKIGLPAELHLLAHCDVMISMDSANMHLASLVGLRVVSVWGATHPCCGFMGYGQRMEDAVQLELPCRPCSVFGNHPCRYGDYHCLGDITPERILEAVSGALENRKQKIAN